ncbi:hypothetical protein HDU82_008933 [Entophlyctis luteolus]|nr:hypothetical protein HDU82_008933 [Entophlyctis luteolus]
MAAVSDLVIGANVRLRFCPPPCACQLSAPPPPPACATRAMCCPPAILSLADRAARPLTALADTQTKTMAAARRIAPVISTPFDQRGQLTGI